MQELRLIGVHEDGQHVLLADGEGGRYRLPLDEALRAAARRDRPRLGQLQIEIDGGLRPRDVQAMIRAGASAEEVADRSGWSVEKVRRYEGPILAEREHVAGLARAVRLRGRGGAHGSTAPTLAARVGQRLAGRGVDPAHADWDSARDDQGQWTVTLTFPAGGRERQARWHFDVPARTVTAADDEARWLSEDDATDANTPIPAPHLASAPVRATTVYDVEAEGGVAASTRRKPPAPPTAVHEEPLDLMSAMRERASHRGRKPRRKTAATQTPVDQAPREDALPLEDIAFDPESMPPPPGAHGLHPLDDPAVGDDVLPAEHEPEPAADTGAVAVPDTEAASGPEAAEPAAAEAEDSPEEDGPDERDEADEPSEDVPDEPSEDDATEAPGPPAQESEGQGRPPAKSARRGRPSVPSWDDVMFGAKPRG